MSDNQFGNFSDLIFKKLKVFHFAVTFFHSVCQIIPMSFCMKRYKKSTDFSADAFVVETERFELSSKTESNKHLRA